MRPWRTRSCGIIAGAAASVALAACGSAQSPAAAVHPGTYPVAVSTASFPAAQTLSGSARMVIVVRNAGAHTIPDVSVTICNVTCRYPAPAGEGTSAPAFGDTSSQPNLANPGQQIWIVDRAPGTCGYNCSSVSQGEGGALGGSAVTADANTWALGRLAPGQSARFVWRVTPVQPGRHVIAWEVSAGIYGKARAVLPGGGRQPHGTFTVHVNSTAPNTYVNNSGAIVSAG